MVERSGCAVPLPVFRPLPEGVTSARQRWFGANTPWYLVWFTRGLGTSAARRAMKSKGSKTTCVVPSRYGVLSRYTTFPCALTVSRFSATAGLAM